MINEYKWLKNEGDEFNLMKKKMILWAVIAIMMMAFIPFAGPSSAAYDYNVKVLVNGTQVNFPDQKPFIDSQKGRTYVPLRFVSEALGGVVDWNGNTQTASVNKAGTAVLMKIGSVNPTVNGQVKTIDAAAMLMNSRTVVPLRFVSECLGAKVEWNAVTRTVVISTTSQEVPVGYKATSKGYWIPTDTKLEYQEPSSPKSGINIRLNIIIPRGDLETQFNQAEEILARVHGSQAAKQAVDYARQKTTILPELKDTEFGNIRVVSGYNSPRIYIEVWR